MKDDLCTIKNVQANVMGFPTLSHATYQKQKDSFLMKNYLSTVFFMTNMDA